MLVQQVDPGEHVDVRGVHTAEAEEYCTGTEMNFAGSEQ